MAGPAVFSGKRTKLLSAYGVLNQDGSINDNDGVYNYIANGHFDVNTTGWNIATVTLASGVPSGAPSIGSAATITMTRTTTNPLFRDASLNISGTSWGSGQGFCSTPFTVQRGDLGKVLTLSFFYEPTSNYTLASWAGDSTQTLQVWVWDVTASQWIQPAGFRGMNQGVGQGICQATWQSSVTVGQQYQIFLFNAQSALAAGPLVINFDSFEVKQKSALYGPSVSDWISYTPTFTNLGTCTGVNAFWRRVGDSVQLQVTCTLGTTAASEARVTMPNGIVPDATKIATTTNVGHWWNANPSITPGGVLALTGGTNYLVFSSGAVGNNNYGSINGTNIQGTGSNTFGFFATVPVQGWGNSQLLSSESGDSRLVSFSSNKTSTQSVTANVTDITFTSLKDTHGGWSGSSYIVQVSGDYQVGATMGVTSGTAVGFFLYKNTSVLRRVCKSIGSANTVWPGSILVENLKAGDVLSLRSDTTDTAQGGAAGSGSEGVFWINKIQSPSQIAATESVNLAVNASTTSLTNNTPTTVVWTNVEFDSHGQLNAGKDTVTIQTPGKYLISATLDFPANATGYRTVRLLKNGSVVYNMTTQAGNATVVQIISATRTLKLNAGDTLQIQGFQNSGGALSLSTDSAFSLTRVGN